jgi:hypothetical protein
MTVYVARSWPLLLVGLYREEKARTNAAGARARTRLKKRMTRTRIKREKWNQRRKIDGVIPEAANDGSMLGSHMAHIQRACRSPTLCYTVPCLACDITLLRRRTGKRDIEKLK